VTAKREKPFHLDMDFDEALRRFVGTDPRELDEPTKPKRQRERSKRLRPAESKTDKPGKAD
jgi:hypothetical protein